MSHTVVDMKCLDRTLTLLAVVWTVTWRHLQCVLHLYQWESDCHWKHWWEWVCWLGGPLCCCHSGLWCLRLVHWPKETLILLCWVQRFAVMVDWFCCHCLDTTYKTPLHHSGASNKYVHSHLSRNFVTNHTAPRAEVSSIKVSSTYTCRIFLILLSSLHYWTLIS